MSTGAFCPRDRTVQVVTDDINALNIGDSLDFGGNRSTPLRATYRHPLPMARARLAPATYELD